MHDLDAYLTLPDPYGFVRVMFEAPSDSHIYVIGVFRTSNESEIDFQTLPLDLREIIQEKCKQVVQERKPTEQ